MKQRLIYLLIAAAVIIAMFGIYKLGYNTGYVDSMQYATQRLIQEIYKYQEMNRIVAIDTIVMDTVIYFPVQRDTI